MSRFRVFLLAALGAAGLVAGLVVGPALSGSSTPSLEPDTSFNNGDPVLIAFPEPADATFNGSMGSTAVGRQSSGKVIVAGYHFATVGGQAVSSFDVARVTASGALDPTFGTNGYASIDPVAGAANTVYGMAIQPDDKIVLVGQTSANGMAIARLTADGAPDASFGTDGVVVDGATQTASAVALDANGDIDVASFDGTVSRYTSTGSLDSGFGTSGHTAKAMTEGRGITVQGDGEIVLAGQQGFSPSTAVVARFTIGGLLDSSFGTGGVASITPGGGSSESLSSVAMQGTSILVGGQSSGNGELLARLTPAGALDSTFGTGGRVVVGDGNSISAILYIPKPQIASAGGADTGSTSWAVECQHDPTNGTKTACTPRYGESPDRAMTQTCGDTSCTVDVAGEDNPTGDATVKQYIATDTPATTSTHSTTFDPCQQTPLPPQCRYDLTIDVSSPKTFPAAGVGKVFAVTATIENAPYDVSSPPLDNSTTSSGLYIYASVEAGHYLKFADAPAGCAGDPTDERCSVRALAPGQHRTYRFLFLWQQKDRTAWQMLKNHDASAAVGIYARVADISCTSEERTCRNNSDTGSIAPR